MNGIMFCSAEKHEFLLEYAICICRHDMAYAMRCDVSAQQEFTNGCRTGHRIRLRAADFHLVLAEICRRSVPSILMFNQFTWPHSRQNGPTLAIYCQFVAAECASAVYRFVKRTDK